MKILFCTYYPSKLLCGVSTSARGLVGALSRRGVDVTVYTTDCGWDDEEKARERFNGKLKIFPAPFANDFDFSPEMTSYFNKTCDDFDLIHFNSIYSFSTIMGAFLARRHRIPYIISPHGNFIPKKAAHHNKGMRSPLKKRLFYKLFSRRALAFAKRIVCGSHLEAQDLRGQTGFKNIVFINNGIDVRVYCDNVDSTPIESGLSIPTDTYPILYLGRLSEEKGTLFLLDVWERLMRVSPRLVLVIAGQGRPNFCRKVKERTSRLKYPDSVLIAGPMMGKSKLTLLQKAKCLVLPSYFESFGIVVLESLLSGTPAITSIGTPWQSLEQNRLGRWLPLDVRVWQEAISSVVEDEDYHSPAFLERSRRWVIENFSWEKLAERYIELYQECGRMI